MGDPRRLILPSGAAQAMLEHAHAELPNEACGLVAGDRRTGRATAFHTARNEHASPWRFSVHPEDLVSLVPAIEARGEDLLAIFHSHVSGPAVPSPTDLREATAYPGVVHLVASLADPEAGAADLRAWEIADGAGREIELVIG